MDNICTNLYSNENAIYHIIKEIIEYNINFNKDIIIENLFIKIKELKKKKNII